jgi:hypothetical protein
MPPENSLNTGYTTTGYFWPISRNPLYFIGFKDGIPLGTPLTF